ncbi:MAG: glycosyltransferase family 1 protein [Rhodanobacteraceae bacterium]|nr:MAG: glycosyltransferase family 1 protein [Rhodanobacteraceae bacterium]
MHIAFVSETWPPQVNGVALTVQTFAQGLAARGHQIDVVRPGASGHEGGVEMVHARGARIPRYPELQFGMPQGSGLRKRWLARRPDVVYIATEGLLGSSAMRVANALNIPVATGFHTRFDDYAGHYGIGLLSPLVRAHQLKFHRRGQMTFVPTRALVRELNDASVPNVRKLRRGVDTTLFSPERRDPTLRRHWGVDNATPVMAYVGRIAAEKGLGLALQAYRALQTRVPGARMVMVGDGPQRVALAEAYPDAIFVGTKHGEELATYYASADIFLFPSLTETFGNVVLEAMASGLPVVAFDRAAAQEHVANGISGLVVPGADARGFISSAYELGRDREVREMLGTNARLVAQQCAPDKVIAEMEILLRSMLWQHVPGDFRAAS